MELLYLLAVEAYGFGIRIASFFLPKAKEWLEGRQDWEKKLADQLQGKPAYRIWFHCPSLGEFEQGRPVLEQIRQQYPDACIVLTFFSYDGIRWSGWRGGVVARGFLALVGKWHAGRNVGDVGRQIGGGKTSSHAVIGRGPARE